MAPPQGPTGPASPPTGNPGLAANALSQVREAVRLLETALPNIPTGSKPYKAVIDSISKLSKEVPASNDVPGVQQTQLRALMQKSQQDAMLQQLTRALGAGGGGTPGAAPPGVPGMPGAAAEPPQQIAA